MRILYGRASRCRTIYTHTAACTVTALPYPTMVPVPVPVPSPPYPLPYRYRYRYPLHAQRTHLWGQPYHTRYWYSCSYSLSPVSRTEFRVPRIICCARPTFLARVLRLLSIEELSAYPLVADGGGSVAAAGRLLSTFSCKTACAVQLH